MSGLWVRLENDFMEDDKFDGISPAAGWLWIGGLCYSNRRLTDGRLVQRALDRIKLDTHVYDADAAIAELVERNLWARSDDGDYMVVNYAKYQKTKQSYETDRQKASGYANRRELFRGDVASNVKARDGSECRYCGMNVSWVDKRSPVGASYDHVDPHGPTTIENVVIACRGCNSKKGERTPEQAGMRLLPPPDRPTPTPYGRDPIPEPTQELTQELTPDSNRNQNGASGYRYRGKHVDPIDLDELRSRRSV